MIDQALRGRFGDPLPGLTADQLALFRLGEAEFTRDLLPRDGLGPVFIERSCVACHALGGPGGADALDEPNHFVRRFATTTAGKYDPLAALGGDVLQTRSLAGIQPGCSVAPEVVPAAATIHSRRNPQQVVGAGLIDAIPAATILAGVGDKGDGVKGKANLDAAGNPGRFGWKAQANNLTAFTATAALGTLGLTTPLLTGEPLPQGLPIPTGCTNADVGASSPNDASGAVLYSMTAWQALLAPPTAARRGGHAERGKALFTSTGCAKCHTPELVTGSYDLPLRTGATLHIDALSNKPAPLYSDLLLHDMGAALDEGVVMRQATGSEFRTAPLWGLRYRVRYLHDGRADSVSDAILAHGGEAQIIRDRYAALCDGDRWAILRFLDTL